MSALSNAGLTRGQRYASPTANISLHFGYIPLFTTLLRIHNDLIFECTRYFAKLPQNTHIVLLKLFQQVWSLAKIRDTGLLTKFYMYIHLLCVKILLALTFFECAIKKQLSPEFIPLFCLIL